jgi:hypothetical protein
MNDWLKGLSLSIINQLLLLKKLLFLSEISDDLIEKRGSISSLTVFRCQQGLTLPRIHATCSLKSQFNTIQVF